MTMTSEFWPNLGTGLAFFAGIGLVFFGVAYLITLWEETNFTSTRTWLVIWLVIKIVAVIVVVSAVAVACGDLIRNEAMKR